MLAATYRARETQNCGIIWSMAMDGGYCTTWVCADIRVSSVRKGDVLPGVPSGLLVRARG
jgi:hypothetical protein